MERIAVLIPCYNESQTVTKVVADWRSKLPEATIYVYDNNSTDGTGDLALKAGAVVKKCYQQGKGNVVRKMFQEVEAQCYIIVDGDDTYPAEAGRKMAEEVLEHDADMVIGDRLSSTYFQENKRPFHNFGNALVRKAINWIFACDISDIMTGYRAFSYRFVKAFPVLSQGFEIETEMTIFAVDKNMRIVNEIIDYRDRPQGSVSKLNTYSDGVKVLLTIARLFKDYRPAYFFGLVSLLLVLLATCFFVPVLADFIKSGVVDKIPTLIVCGFTVLSAIISLFSVIIIQSEKNQ
ncbi:MAG: glycosyltransferase [Oscillospiraceae bacterium]|nr:glycosyltransferase [Oscillospiraceae bacterium]